jgi:PHD/YefM family antitoxin component YafN of YafNO toxin-antitoxin module
MADTIVASSEFQTRAGLYLDQAGKSPVFITKHKRLSRVLLDIDEYNRLKARDARMAYWSHELPQEAIEALENADLSHLSAIKD